MLLMERETFEQVLMDAVERAGGLRPLTRVLARNGVPVHASTLIGMRDGTTKPHVRIAQGLADEWPDLAARMYAAMGVVTTATPDLVSDVERIAAERGIPAMEVLSTLVNEELARITKK